MAPFAVSWRAAEVQLLPRPLCTGQGSQPSFLFLFRFMVDPRRIFRWCLCRTFNPLGMVSGNAFVIVEFFFSSFLFFFLFQSDPCHPQSPKKAPLVGKTNGAFFYEIQIPNGSADCCPAERPPRDYASGYSSRTINGV